MVWRFLSVGILLLTSKIFAAGTSFKMPSGEACQLQFVPQESTAGEAFPINKIFTALVLMQGPKKLGDVKLTIDARMPLHNHGMIVKPRVVKKSANEFLIEGLKFHMAGEWVVTFKIQSKQNVTQVEIPLKL